jgi:hypothetical protein
MYLYLPDTPLIIDEKREGKMEGEGRRVRRLKQPLHDCKEMKTHWKLKEEALDSTLGKSLWKRLCSFRKAEYLIMRIAYCPRYEHSPRDVPLAKDRLVFFSPCSPFLLLEDHREEKCYEEQL